MSAQIITVTVQAALFSALSTTLAQSITTWQHRKLTFDILPFISFMIIACITTPPNYLYQRFLEDNFPSRVPVKTHDKKTDDLPKQGDAERLSKSNTVTKFLLDQSIGAAANTVMFICLLGLLKGKSLSMLTYDVQKDFWPMLTAGWRVWPMVTLLNLVVVPFDYRMLVGNTAGVFWGVYITMKNM